MSDEPTPTEYVRVECTYCWHWETGLRTKEQIADWLRVHHAARLRSIPGPVLERSSTCPHPCREAVAGSATPEEDD